MLTTTSVALTAYPLAFGVLNIGARLATVNPYAHNPLTIDPHVLSVMFAIFVVLVLGFGATTVWGRQDWAIAWSLGICATVVCSPFLEDPHLEPFVLVPILLAATGRYPRRLAVELVGVLMICTALRVLPNHAAEGLVVMIKLAAGFYAGRAGWQNALLTSAAVFLAAPSSAGVSGFGLPRYPSLTFSSDH